MRFVTRLLLLLLAVTVLTPCRAEAEFKKTKIAVLDFQLQGETFDNPDMGTIVAEWFITAMVREGRFDVVERRLLEKVLNEQKLAMTGIVDASSASQIGKVLGVKVVITGSVMKLHNIIEINARIIDVENGSIITAENVRALSSTNLQDLVIQMSGKIMKSFPLEGYVVNRSGDAVTLDLGLRTGVKSGMQFLVYKEGQVIKHPKTGEVLDVERIHTGTVTITNVMQKICTASIDEETSPGAINYGQMVKSLIDNTPKETRLYVNTLPEDAKIRVLNISPPYERGMILPPGPYHIEVSAPGYKAVRQWLTLEANEEKSVLINLANPGEPLPAPGLATVHSASPPPSLRQPAGTRPSAGLTAKQAKYIKMLESSNARENRDAAKMIEREHLSDPVVLDVVEQKLLRDYQRSGSDHSLVDTMSWYCKALGASGQTKYRSTLARVARDAPHRKLRGYAQKSLSQL